MWNKRSIVNVIMVKYSRELGKMIMYIKKDINTKGIGRGDG